MIRKDIDPLALATKYQQGEPFPHIVIDGFLDEEIATKLADELEVQNVDDWHFDPHSEQVNKWSMPELHRLPVTTSETLREFNDVSTLNFFEKLTGIGPLIPDDQYVGGGVHVTAPGGRLGIHADFNLHPTTGHHRRLNALLFLNRRWNPDWKGQLQLWDSGITRCVKSVDPLFNRLVIFTVTDNSFHGVPEKIDCPPGTRRLSLALYYYTEERPENEKAPFHWATWKQPVK